MANSFPGEWLDECASTNIELNARAKEGAPHGFWVAAKSQTAGRGRQGNGWVSQAGNLFLSVLVRNIPGPEFWTWTPLIAALAVRDDVVSLRTELSKLLLVKWPNDLWLEHRKCCGILCEGHGSSGESYIIVGIGLNCMISPQGPGLIASSVQIEPAIILPRIVDRLMQRLHEADREELKETWTRWSEFPVGTDVQWSDKKEGSYLGSGRVLGLGSFGELQVISTEGKCVSLFSEEVSLRAAVAASGESLL